jgi:RND family efflux transporter MFP subunit
MGEMLEKLRIERGLPAATSSGSRRLWLFLAITGVLLLFLFSYFFIQSRAVRVEVITVAQVYPTQSFTLLNASGYVVASQKAAVAAKTTGRLEWLGVEEGSRVKAGEIVARLENRDLVASLDHLKAVAQSAASSLEQARAELTDARQAYDRQHDLLKQGIVAKADFDTAEARYRRAVAGVAGAEASLRAAQASRRGADVALDYSLIRAPFDGVVLTKNADIGDIITPLGAAANAKAAVVTIADLASLEVEADVAESNLAQVKKNQPCEVSLDALPGIRFQGYLHTIVPTADRSKASVMVKIRFSDHDPRILPEMSARVAFLAHSVTQEEQQPRIAINPSAISVKDSETRVFRIVNDRVKVTPITLGRKLGDLQEVNGLKTGERIILRPLEKLKDGSRIMVLEK